VRNIALVLTLALTGCGSLPVGSGASERDLADVFRTVLPKIGSDKVTFVAASGLDPAARRALRRVRPMLDVSQIPGLAPKGVAGLPAGHFLIGRLSIDGNKAVFSGTAGPVPPGPLNFNCGIGYAFELSRSGKNWVITKSSLIMC
jgi:hypothetical protein